MVTYRDMTKHHPFTAVDDAAARYDTDPTDENLRALAVSAASGT